MAFGIDDIAVAALPTLVSGIGSLFGLGGSAKDQEAAKALEDARKAYEAAGIPSVEAQKLALQKLTSVGQITPEQEQAIQQAQSEATKITIDPRLKEAQMKALAQLGELGTGGLTPADRIALQEQQRGVEGAQNAEQAAILQNMASRGMGGSGAELAARLASTQGAANRSAQAGADLVSQAQMKGLQALQQYGQLGGQIRGQEFGEKSDVARAQDAINAFNAQMKASSQARNVAAKNQAQEANLTNQQNIANQNVNISNVEQEKNKALLQQEYENKLRKAQGIAGTAESQANLAEKQAGTANKALSGLASGVGSAYSTYAADQAKKEAEAKKAAGNYFT